MFRARPSRGRYGWAGAGSSSAGGSSRLQASYLNCPGASGDCVSTPGSAALDIAGDLTITIRLSLNDWTPAAAAYLVNKFQTGGQISYLLSVGTTGLLMFEWTEDGSTVKNATSTVPNGIADGAIADITLQFQANNGAAGNTTTFLVNGVQLGAQVVGAGVSSIFSSTSNVTISGYANGTGNPLAGKVYGASIYGGTVAAPVIAASFAPSLASAGSTSLRSGTGEVWTLQGATSLV